MQVTTLSPTLIQMTRLRFVNAYLVREDDGFTLVDTTLKRAGKDIIAIARDAGGDVRRIVLTPGPGDRRLGRRSHLGEGAARPGSAAARRRPRPGRPRSAGGDGPRDRPRLMARAGLSADALVEAAAALADREGLEAVTLARLAADAGVRPPS